MRKLLVLLLCLALVGCSQPTAAPEPEKESEVETEEAEEEVPEVKTLTNEEIDQCIANQNIEVVTYEDEMTGVKLFYSGRDHYLHSSGVPMPSITYKKEYYGFLPFFVYLSRGDGQISLNIVLTYHGDNWIFFDKWLVKSGNDELHEFQLNALDADRDVWETGTINEKYNVYPSDEVFQAFDEIIKNRRGVMRFVGDEGDYTFELTGNMVLALKEMVGAYRSVIELM